MIQSPTEVPEKSPLAARHWPTCGVGRVWVAPGTALYDDGAVGLVGTEGTIMPHRAAKMSALLLVVSLRAASAADQNLWDECTHARDSDASIAACTTILQAADETPANRAIAYYARAGAYKTKREYDQAVA